MPVPWSRGRRTAVLALALGGWSLALAPTVDLVRPAPSVLAAGLDQALQGPLATAEGERARNPEWTLMADLFSVLAWSNAALADPAREAVLLEHMDSAIAATLQTEAEGGQFALLLPYARRESFRDATGRSVFVDGEVALMLAARLSVARDPELEDELRRRVGIIESALARSPTLSAESYPNECWTFCNTTALAALVLSDRVFGTDHRPLARAWVELAKTELLDPQTGLLISSYTYEGEVLDGPEGSSIFMVAHNLQLLDPAFAQDQYARAAQQLSNCTLGFCTASEWPAGAPGRVDVDSGGIVPGLDASPGASGLALLGAAAFDDDETRDGLLRSMEFAAVPTRDSNAIWYRAAGRIGNAVAAYALNFGPLWAQSQREASEAA